MPQPHSSVVHRYLHFISDFDLPKHTAYGEKGLRHIMTCEVSRFQLYIPLPLVFVVIYVRILYLFIMLRLSPLTNV